MRRLLFVVPLMIFAGAAAWMAVPLIRGDDPSVLPSAPLRTLTVFSGLTAIVFVWKQDFSFLRAALGVGGLAAMGLIVSSLLFGFSLGVWFSGAMIVFASGAVLHDTSNVLLHYPEDRYVGAALELFSSVALMFWYILRIFISRR